jgi:hypothetical protein
VLRNFYPRYDRYGSIASKMEHDWASVYVRCSPKGPGALFHRTLIAELAAQLRLPAVYPFRYHGLSGGLISNPPICQCRHLGRDSISTLS